MKIKYGKLILAIIITQLAGIIGSFFTTPNIPTWYANINKPGFTPPSWLFAPVWITLYLMMGISLYLIWEKKLNPIWFYIQLVLNSLWSILFFGLQQPMIAFIEIMALWAFILITIITAFKKSRAASYLLIPYLAWVSFAGALNLAIAILN